MILDDLAVMMVGGDVAPIPVRPPWMADAACREHPEIPWVPVDERRCPDAVEAARAVCAGCLTRTECLTYALREPALVGLWAGTTSVERKAMRRESAA